MTTAGNYDGNLLPVQKPTVENSPGMLFIFQQENDLKHKDKIMGGFRSEINVLKHFNQLVNT